MRNEERDARARVEEQKCQRSGRRMPPALRSTSGPGSNHPSLVIATWIALVIATWIAIVIATWIAMAMAIATAIAMAMAIATAIAMAIAMATAVAFG